MKMWDKKRCTGMFSSGGGKGMLLNSLIKLNHTSFTKGKLPEHQVQQSSQHPLQLLLLPVKSAKLLWRPDFCRLGTKISYACGWPGNAPFF